MTERGTLYGVGVGPGAPDLLTLRALRTIEACPVIACPETRGGGTVALDIVQQAVDLSGKEILRLSFAMQRSAALLRETHQRAAYRLRGALDSGKDVAMLNLGDVSLYASFAYVQELLAPEGYTTVLVPGVTSLSAAAAALGVSLTDMNQPLHIYPAGAGQLPQALAAPGSRVLMKAGGALADVLETLRQQGMLEQTMMVQRCGMEGERLVKDWQNDPYDPAEYFSLLLIKDSELKG